MNELTIEQKAELYDKVVERAKKWYNAPNVDKIPTFDNKIIEDIFPELKEPEDEEVKKEIIKLIKFYYGQTLALKHTISRDKMLTWLEKQGQSKKTSIWKHWKNGIAGNGEGKLIFLIKSGATYSLSSCLSFECDYIELSELENLMLEKQDNANEEYWRGYREGKQEVLDKYSELEKQIVQNINIPWHDVSEEPEEQREIFCKWKIWHDVVFYHADTKTFWNGEYQIEDVIKWAYIDDILKEQPQSYLVPKSASQAI